MGSRHWAKSAILATACVAVSCLLVGCPAGKYTGGGWIPSAVGGNKKATFGFNFDGVDQDGDGLVDQVVQPFFDEDGNPIFFVVWWLGQGQFQYNDHGTGVKFHFDCDQMESLPEDWPNSTGSSMYANIDIDAYIASGFQEVIILSLVWEGTYTSQAGTGHVTVAVTAQGDGIDAENDWIEVTLVGGPYDGYHNAGTLQGGNIQWHPAN